MVWHTFSRNVSQAAYRPHLLLENESMRRYVLVRQNDQSDCGAAALATVALHHGRPAGLEQMRDLTGTDRQGANLLGMLRAAERLGFAARAVRAPYEALLETPMPAIAHLHDKYGAGHFVVIHQARRDSVVVADPARGVGRRTREEFASQWGGNLLLLVPDPSAAVASRPAPVGPLVRMIGLMRGHAGLVFESMACAVLLMLLGVSTSFFVQHLVDVVLVRNEVRLLHALGTGMVLIVLFRTLFAALRSYLLAHVGLKIDLTLLSGYMRHLLHLPVRFFETRRLGEIQSRAADSLKIRDAVTGVTTTAVVDGLLVVLVLLVLCLYDLPMGLVALGFVGLLVLAGGLHDRPVLRVSRDTMENWSQLSAHLIEDVSGVQTIKAYAAERRRADQGERRLVEFARSSLALQKLGVSLQALGLLLTGLAGVVVLWYGGVRVVDGALTIGQLMFVSSLMTYLMEPLNRLMTVTLRVREAMVAVDRLYQVLDLPVEPDGSGQAAFTELRQGIELRDVTFRYGSRGNVLDRVNLTIPAGKSVAIVGESGSGKSTLLNLLLGFHAPTGGRVFVDGVDLQDLDLATLRRRIGLVSQDSFVFSGSVRENIALGKPGASLDEVIAAARAAGLDEFIAGLPERYITPLGERGANLSGGQRQRLAIARALLCQPDILIFDEATSHLDTAMEKVIQENLRTALSGRTVVLVAHRLNTIKDADLIYVMHEGRVAEQGTHRHLLSLGGKYAALYRSQTDEAIDVRQPLEPRAD
jgi:ATP-binding cassette, subfamily C, bacteriocin exporter